MAEDEASEKKNVSFTSPEAYVPAGLASFVAKARVTLQETKLTFQSPSPAKSLNSTISLIEEQDISFQIQEDDDDIRLKQQVLAKFNQTNDGNGTILLEMQTAERPSIDDDKTGSILETANMLLGMDNDKDDEAAEGIEFTESDIISPDASPEKTISPVVDISNAPTQEMSNVAEENLLGMETTSVKQQTDHATASDMDLLGMDTVTTSAEQSRQTTTNVASDSDFLGFDTSPTKQAETPLSPPSEDSQLITSGLTFSSPSDEIVAESTQDPVVVASSPAALKIETITASPITVAEPPKTPQESIEVSFASSTKKTNNLLAMSVMPQTTEPLFVVDAGSSANRLSASTPELPRTSPWRQAFQNVAASLHVPQSSSSASESVDEPATANHCSTTSTPEFKPTLPSSKDITSPPNPNMVVDAESNTPVHIASPPKPTITVDAEPNAAVNIALPPKPTTVVDAGPDVAVISESTPLSIPSAKGTDEASPLKPVEPTEMLDNALTESFAEPAGAEAVNGVAMAEAVDIKTPSKLSIPIEKSSAEETATKVKLTGTSVSPLSMDEDDFLPNRRTKMATPPARRPAQVSKSEASKRVAQKSSEETDRSKLRKSMPAVKKNKHVDRPRMASTSTKTTVSTSTAGSSVAAAATQARASPPTLPVAKSNVSSDDGVVKAKERVRQKKLAAANNGKTEQVKKPESRSSTRSSALSAEDGRKLARERVRRRQVQPPPKPETSSVKGKENRGRMSNKASVSASVNRSMASTAISASSIRGTTASSRKCTVPLSPKFATKALLGEKSRGTRVRRESSLTLNPNPITRALDSPTHGNNKEIASTRSSSRPRLTVPMGPRLSTTTKYGNNPPPALREKSVKAAPQAAPPKKREFKVTQPVPFHFHDCKPSTSVKRSEPSLAEQTELFARKGLRADVPARSSRTSDFKLTIPKSPQFHPIVKRALPKSRAEMEEEMMEYYKEHPFKARSVGAIEVSMGPSHKVPRRRLTQPVPFHLRADERAEHAKPVFASPDPELRDLEECKKQFHARPMPRLCPTARKDAEVRPVTTPKPFSLLTDTRSAVRAEPHGLYPDEIELSKRFHARPLPRTTFTVPPKTRRQSVPSTMDTPKHAGPPKLATSSRTEPREAIRLASQKNAESMAKRREQLALRKKREKHQEDMARATMTSPTPNIEPFHLQSEARHKAYQRQLAEQRAQEEQEQKQQMLFRARPPRLSDPPPPIHSNKPATTPEPFHLDSVTRHEQFQELRRHRLDEEEKERQRLMEHKARPVPKSTYKYNPLTPQSQKKLMQLGDEERELDSARKKAMEALRYAEEEVSPVRTSPAGRSLLGSIMGT